MADSTPQATASETASTDVVLERGKRKTRVGTISSDKMDKTIVVEVNTLKPHPLYGRTVRQTTKFKAHDETNDGHTGDTVEIMECRPMSREKRWRLVRIIERAK